MAFPESSAHALAATLANSLEYQVVFAKLPKEIIPKNESDAYAVQQQILAIKNSYIGGWKVGAQSLDAPIRCAPLPENCVINSPATLPLDVSARSGLELEIAFSFGRSFLPAQKPYTDIEVIAGVTHMAAAIEVVASRYQEWPEVDKLAQLADLQNHKALIIGPFAPYGDDYPFVDPDVSFSYDNVGVLKKIPSNPAGDPRRLLTWLVNHCILQGTPIVKGTIVTTGSYTGMYFPGAPGLAIGMIAGLPPVQLTLT